MLSEEINKSEQEVISLKQVLGRSVSGFRLIVSMKLLEELDFEQKPIVGLSELNHESLKKRSKYIILTKYSEYCLSL